MFNLGWPEVIIVIGVAALIFGPKKIPELGNTLGKTLRNFKSGISQADLDQDDSEDDIPVAQRDRYDR